MDLELREEQVRARVPQHVTVDVREDFITDQIGIRLAITFGAFVPMTKEVVLEDVIWDDMVDDIVKNLVKVLRKGAEQWLKETA